MRLSPFVKQLYVALPTLLAILSAGGALCYPMVLLRQLKSNTTTIELNFETATWMGSIHGIASVPSIFMPSLMQWQGRKFVFIVTSVITTAGWLLAYFATNAAALLVGESFHGFGTSSLLTVSCLTITEMMSPKYRDTFVLVLFIIETVGMTADGLLVQYCHWKTISIIMLVPLVLSVIVACTIPESPYWLAYKGDFVKCETVFVWLRGSDEASYKELNELKNMSKDKSNAFGVESLADFWKRVTSRDFYIPAMHICVLQFLIHGSGSLVILIYSIELFEKASSNEAITVYGAFILNITLCIGMCIGIVLDRYFNKKYILLWSSFCAAAFLMAASGFSYFQGVGLWPRDSLTGLYCLTGFVLFSSVGILGLTWSVAAALMPMKNRGLGGALMIINTGLYHTTFLKSAPYMFLYLDMWGTYLVYAAVCVTCGLLIWRYVPEVKERSLQEIENYYKYGTYFPKNSDDDVSKNMIPKNNYGLLH